jgi:tripartite ATP-independent transporter DctM subunit
VPQEKTTFLQKLRASRSLAPIIALSVGVFAGMFSGVATATEVGALGVVGALIIAGFHGTLNLKIFWESAAGAVRVSCMIGLLIAGANVFSSAMAFTGIPTALAEWVKEMHFHRYTLIAALVVVYLILGTVLEGVSMILLTTSIALPMVVAAGFDPIWFGVFIVIMTELASLSPPVGFNLSVLQIMTRRDMAYVAWAALPFFIILTLSVALFAVFPEIVTFLPKWIMSR